MYLTTVELEYCLGKATEIAEQFRLEHIGSDDPQRSIDNLAVTCRKRLQIDIKLLKLDIPKHDAAQWGATFLHGDGSADICIVSDLNYCWERYVLCKELFHVLIDKEAYRNMNIEEHLKETTIAFPNDDSKPKPAVQVEVLAEMAAMEFLLPYECRLKELNGENKGNFLAIAEKYKVPQLLVERYLSLGYMENLAKFTKK